MKEKRDMVFDATAAGAAGFLAQRRGGAQGGEVRVTSDEVRSQKWRMARGPADAGRTNVECQMSNVRPLGFSSKEYDTASGLSYYGFRYYDPHSARWMNKDPAGIAYDSQPYKIVFNAPLVLADEHGCEAIYPQRTRELLVTYYGKVYEIFFAGDYCRCVLAAQKMYSTVKWTVGVPIQVVAWTPQGRWVTQAVKVGFRILGTTLFLADNPAFSVGALVAVEFCKSSVYKPRGMTSNGNAVPAKVTIEIPKPTAFAPGPLGLPARTGLLPSHPLLRSR